MVFRKYRKKSTALLSVLLSTAILLQSLYFPVHTAHATGVAEGTTEVNVDFSAKSMTFYIGSGIALRYLAAKVNIGHFADLSELGLTLQVKLTDDIDLTDPVSDAEVTALTSELSSAYAALKSYIGDEADALLAADQTLISNIRTQLANSDTSWTPMGTEDIPFTGSFDGCGYEISGLSIVVETDENGEVAAPFIGFIGFLMDGCVQNLTVDGVITADAPITTSATELYVGMIAGGMTCAFLNNCKASGTITALASIVTESNPEGSEDSGEPEEPGDSEGSGESDATEAVSVAEIAVGGLVGLGTVGGIINCGNETEITVENITAVGGIASALIAYADETSAIVPCIANSYSTGTITGSARIGGGLAGFAAASLVNNYFNGTMALTSLGMNGDDFGLSFEAFGSGSIGTIVGVLSNEAEGVEITIDLWCNYFPEGYCPETAPVETVDSIPNELLPLFTMIFGKAVGSAYVGELFKQTFLTSSDTLKFFIPLPTGNSASADLCTALNTQLWRSRLALEELIEIAQSLNVWNVPMGTPDGQSPKAMCWTVLQSGNYPIQYSCPYMETGAECAACGRGASYSMTISNEAELFALANAVNSGIYNGKSFHLREVNLSVQLLADIELTQPWTPMGTKDAPFSANFEGNGHTISGMEITVLGEVLDPAPDEGEGEDEEESQDQGGEGQGGENPVQPSAMEFGLNAVNSLMAQRNEEPTTWAAQDPEAQDSASDTIELFITLGTMAKASMAHTGFIGYLYEGGVQNLTVEGTIDVTADSTLYHVGMIAGGMKDSILNNCRAKGSVHIIGYNPLLEDSALINTVDSSSDDSLDSWEAIKLFFGLGSSAGGLVGQALRSIIINCGNEADVNAEMIFFSGGIAGAMMTEGDWAVLIYCLLNSYSVGTVTGGMLSGGGLVGYTADSLINNYFGGRIFKPDASLNDSPDSVTGTLSGVLTNAKDFYALLLLAASNGENNELEFVDLDFWYNHYPLNYLPEELPVDPDEDIAEDETPEQDLIAAESIEDDLAEMLAGVIGTPYVSEDLMNKLAPEFLAGRVLVPYEITAPADPENDAYDIADPKALSEALNSQLELTNDIIATHLTNLENSPWSHLIEKMNGAAFSLMCWDVGPDGFPVQYECVYETSGGTEQCPHCGRPIHTEIINSVEISWGNMLFEYADNGNGTGAWNPVSADGDLITITNLSETATMRATIRYNPSTSTPGITDIQANLVNIKADPNAAEDTLYPHHNIAATAAKLDVSPPSVTPAADKHNTLTARLQLTGAPTAELYYAPLGTVTITISQPQTEITTWGHKHDNPDPTDPVQIHWVIRLDGCANSNIPGSTLTNELLPPAPYSTMGTHLYTSDDMTTGITVGAAHMADNGTQLGWYQWNVDTYDPNVDASVSNKLVWDLTTTPNQPSWSYQFPDSIPGTNGTVPLGNKNWSYYIEFTSTTTGKLADEGILGYMNRATIEESSGFSGFSEGWVSIEHSETHGNIVPFVSTVDGNYVWEVKAIIPGLEVISEKDEPVVYGKADYLWYIMDYLSVYDGYDQVDYVTNPLGDKSSTTVTVSYLRTVTDGNGDPITDGSGNPVYEEVKDLPVPHIDDADDDDFCAWHNHWAAEADVNGSKIPYGKHVDILCRCYCTEDTCPFWGTNGCGTKYHSDPNEEFCQCWTAPESVTFTFQFSTPVDDPRLANYYNRKGNSDLFYTLVNKAELWRSAEKVTDEGTTVWTGILVDILNVSVELKTAQGVGDAEPATEPSGAT